MTQAKSLSDYPAKDYVPESLGWGGIESLMDIYNLGREKIKTLLTWWLSEKKATQNQLDAFRDKYRGRPHYWEVWQGDARHGNDLAYFGLGRYTQRSYITFLANNLPESEKSEYKDLLLKSRETETKIINLRTLLDHIH